MEMFTFASVVVTIIVSFLLLVFVLQKRWNDSNPRLILPPGTTGLPVIGEMIAYVSSGPEKFVLDRMQKYSGALFRTSLLGEKMAVFCGPEGNKFLFSTANKSITTWWPDAFRKPLTFPIREGTTAQDASNVIRVFLQEFLGPDSLKRCIPIMDFMFRKHLETDWEPFEEITVYPLSKKITFSLACRLFLGMEDTNQVEVLRGYFDLVESLMVSVPVNLPGTSYNKAMRVGKIVKEEILKFIAQKKRQDHKKEDDDDLSVDLFSHIFFRSKNYNMVRMMNEKEVCSVFTSVLLATYHDTSAAITFLLKYLVELPHIYNGVFTECMEIASSKSDEEEALNWNDIHKMKYSWNVAREMLRLMPPSPGTYTEATSDLNFAGFTVPKGWKTFWSVYSTHNDSKYFPNPEEFNPSRFEGNGPTPYTFVPFGGGPRVCPGREYARVHTLVFIYNVVTRYKLEKLDPNEKIKYHITPFPECGLPVRIIPHRRKITATK